VKSRPSWPSSDAADRPLTPCLGWISRWDIAAKAAGTPLHRLLGGGRDDLACYASLDAYSDPDLVRVAVRQAVDAGFSGVKLHGITARRTRPRSPTTTGKIERLHQSLQDELLDVHGPFASLAALQAALDAWRQEYNTDRPHQSLGMACPASRFAPAVSPLPLRVPPQLAAASPRQPEQDEPSPADLPAAAAPGREEVSLVAVEADRMVPPSGNLWIGGQQVWLGPALADRKVTIWVDETSLHVLLDGARIKTLPSRLGVAELARLAAAGARPGGPSPLLAGTGTAVEVERTVNAGGLAGLAGAQLNVGYQLAGQRVTLRMDGTQMMVITSDGELARTMPCPVPAGDRLRLRGARKAAASPPPPSGPVTVQRRVSSRGGIMVATQKIQVGLVHAGKIVTVTAEEHGFRLLVDGQPAGIVPRTTTSEIHRYKAYAAHPRRGRR
jgi:Integrase core domain